MRLIDADALKREIVNLIGEYERRMPRWTPDDMITSGKDAAMKYGARADGAEAVLSLIDNAPTVESEPMKHGRWIDGFICSECNSGNLEGGTSYCPFCGAKMNGVTA